MAGQALLQLTFCADEQHLRELYANLLATAMDKTTAGKVHPGFVDIIRQLSPDEVLLLEHLRRQDGWALSDTYSESRFTGEEISDAFRSTCTAAGICNPGQTEAYLDNLLRLRILREIQWTEGGEVTLEPSNSWRLREGTARMESRRAVEISELGERFIAACVTGPWCPLDVDAGTP